MIRSMIGSNIFAANYDNTRLLSEFQKLAARITWVGTSALPATNVATGTRDSAMVGGSGRGVDEVDSLVIDGIPMLGCLASDADVPTDLGVGYGVDIARCCTAWSSAGMIIQAAMPRGWSGGSHPVTTTARYFTAAVGFDEATSTVGGKEGTPALSGTTADGTVVPVANTLLIVASTWDGVNVSVRTDQGAIDNRQ